MKILRNQWFAKLFLIIGVAVYILTGKYLDSLVLPSCYDPLLALIPVINVYSLVTTGLIGLYIYAIFSLIIMDKKQRAEFWMLFGLFLIIRSILCLSVGLSIGVGPPEGYLSVNDSFIHKMGLLFHNDFFFSGHTAAPFLFYLFFKRKAQKIIFLSGSLLMGIGVLLLHHHYVIDVVSAFPIIYAIYCFHKRFLLQKLN